MEQIDIKQLRQRLELQRQKIWEILSRMEHERRSLEVDSVQDSADRCVTSLSKESLFERSSQQRTLVRVIEAALRRIADDSFGVCVICSDDIEPRRLDALPWAQFCLRCQEAIEEHVRSELFGPGPTPVAATWRRAG
jgi:DnaK suppressor protein